jgi:hypothetical protein
MLSKKGCQQHYQNIVKLPQNLSLYSCVFHYLGIHDAFPLVYFGFNDDLKPDFKVFGNVFIFFANKSKTSTWSSKSMPDSKVITVWHLRGDPGTGLVCSIELEGS